MSDSTISDKRIYIGPFVHAKSLQQLEICTTGAIGVDEHGKIAFVERAAHNGQLLVTPPGFKDAKTIRLRGNSFFFPGFIGELRLRCEGMELDAERHSQIHTFMPRNTPILEYSAPQHF